jgi:exopolysaccharide biosynthesis polyprenyl glycosylphosphotransferase
MRVMRAHLPAEMLAFWLVEFVLGMGLFYVVLMPAGAATSLDVGVADRAAILALTLGLGGALAGLYRPEVVVEARRLVGGTLTGGLMAFPIMFLCAYTLDSSFRGLLNDDSLAVLKVLVAWLVLLLATRLALNYALMRGWFLRTVLIVGSPSDAAGLASAIHGHRPGFIRIGGVVPATALPDLLATRSRGRFGRGRLWGVVVTRAARAEIPVGALMARRHESPLLFGEMEFRESRLRRLDIDNLDPDWLLYADRAGRSRIGQFLHRTLDLVGATILLVVSLPMMLMTAIAIRLEDGKPVLYRQIRVGRDGRTFTVYKFRSMRVDAEARGAVWAEERDPRVTRVGAIIRRLRIDELPQLLNVIAGDMALVGPRPERPEFTSALADQIPGYADRLSVKPGITGWAQVSAPYAASIDDARVKLSYDLYYIKNRSLLLDILILASTVRVVLFREGSR